MTRQLCCRPLWKKDYGKSNIWEEMALGFGIGDRGKKEKEVLTHISRIATQ